MCGKKVYQIIKECDMNDDDDDDPYIYIYQ